MKKALAWLLAAASLFALIACNSDIPSNGTMYGRYVEQEISPPDYEGWLEGMLATEDGLIDIISSYYEYDEVGKLASSGFYRYRSEDYGTSWQQMDMSWAQLDPADIEAEDDDRFTRIRNILPLEEGGVLIHRVTYDQEYELLDSELLLVDGSGNSRDVSFAELEDHKGNAKGYQFANLMCLPGNKVLFTVYTEAPRDNGDISHSMDKLRHFIYDMGNMQLCYDVAATAEAVFTSVDTLYVIDKNAGGLLPLDIVTGEMRRDALPITEDFDNLLNSQGDMAADTAGAIYTVTPQGVSLALHNEDGDSMIMPAENYSFGSPLVVTEGFTQMGDGRFLMNARKNMEEVQLYLFTWDPEAPASSDTVLRIYSLTESLTVRQAISEFRKQHPEITVEYTAPFKDAWDNEFQPNGDSAYATVDDAIRSLSTELLAGAGPDILILDGLSVHSYIEQGILEEISGLVDGTDVITAVTTPIQNEHGGLYYLPVRVKIPLLLSQENSISGYGSIPDIVAETIRNPEAFSFAEPDWDTASDEELEAYFAVAALDSVPMQNRPVLAFRSVEEVANVLFTASAPSVFNDNEGVNRDGLRRLLEDIKTISATFDLPSRENTNFYGTISKGDEGFVWTTYQLAYHYAEHRALAGFDMLDSFENLASLAYHMAEYNSYDWIINEDTGEVERVDRENVEAGAHAADVLSGYDGGTFYPSVMAAIVSNSKEKDAASAFLLCLMSAAAQNEDMVDGLSTSAAGLQAQYSRYLNSFEFKQMGIEPIALDIEGMYAQLTRPAYSNELLLNAIYEQAAAYCGGEATLEEATDSVIRDSEIYFAERQ